MIGYSKWFGILMSQSHFSMVNKEKGLPWHWLLTVLSHESRKAFLAYGDSRILSKIETAD
jgi:hypothetical protein